MKQLADYVNPYIGTISHMLQSTVPEVMLPYGMARCTPVVDDCSDYYCNDRIKGYPLGTAYVMPGVDGNFENTLDHGREDFRCYSLKAELEENNIIVESTVTEHVYLHRFSGGNQVKLAFPNGKAEITDDMVLVKLPTKRTGKTIYEYICIKMTCPIEIIEKYEEEIIFAVPYSLVIWGSVSLISFDSAIKSMSLECGKKTFDDVCSTALTVWNTQLSKIVVDGNTEDKKVVFYTALYRAFQRTTNYTEHGKYYSAYDDKVHDGIFYTGDGLWDSFRCMHPLQLLVDTDRHKNILESYNKMYCQSGLMPSFPGLEGDLPVMIGFHAASLFADALAKGIELDYETAYEGIRKNATEQSMMPWCSDHKATDEDKCYWEKGFFPALAKNEKESCPAAHPFERRQSIAVTLEHAYDDWCAAQIAKKLGKDEDCKMFMNRSQNYRNLFCKEIGLMAPKSIDGKWIEDFNPKFSGGMGGRDYTAENNTWTYTWSVMHDPDGLAELMGGKENAICKLDQLFREGFHNDGNKSAYLAQFPDSTGLMGQFSMGNEPSFHIPYLYDYFGQPWKAQKKLREIMDIWFTNSPTGICGDEDGGAMSSWYVFSALGIYPVCPGKPEYAIGTPVFDSGEIKLENGKTFKIVSKGAGDGLYYINEVKLNGKKLDRPFVTHEEIVAGGTLELKMCRKPDRI